jgi:TRAP-type C4-dicarboxylate transport system substrate-binding protein
MNADLYDSLNADTQKLIKEAGVEATAYQRTLCEEASNKCADAINASGKSKTYDVDPALLKDIQGSLGDVYELVKSKSGIPDLVEEYYNAL